MTLYTKKGCGLCEKAEGAIRAVQKTTEFDLEIVDIEGDAAAYGRYWDRIPVILVEGKEVAEAPIDEARLRAVLTA
ncbi:MAG: glutaredoxin family protein [Chloroflexi bacterium]|nr:glutaredoxin family protein [Chloroflexota bacterium]